MTTALPQPFWRNRVPLLTLAVGLFFSLLLAGLILVDNVRSARNAQAEELRVALVKLSTRLEEEASLLDELVRRFYLDEEFTEQDFAASGLSLVRGHNEWRELVYLKRVDVGTEAAYEQALQKLYNNVLLSIETATADNAITEPWMGMRLPIHYQFVNDDRDQRQPGLDLLTDPVLRPVIQRAAQRGRFVISPITGERDSASLYLFEPIYLRGFPVTDDVQRKVSQLRGMFMLRVDMAAIYRQLEFPTGMDLHLHAGNPSGPENGLEKGFFTTRLGRERSLYYGGENLVLHAFVSFPWWREIGYPVLLILVLGGVLSWILSRYVREYQLNQALLAHKYDDARGRIDIQQRQLRHKDRLLEQQQQVIDEHSIVSMTDIAGRITYVNDLFCEISGYSREELLGQNHRIVNSGVHPPEFFNFMWQKISSGKSWNGVICNRKKNGELYWVESTIKPFLDETGRVEQYISVRTDITEQVMTEQLLDRQRRLLDMLREVMAQFVTSANIQVAARSMINSLCKLTDSEYAFSGEVLYNEQGVPRLRMHAVSENAWQHGSEAFYEQYSNKKLIIDSPSSMFGDVLNTGRPIIINNDAVKPESGAAPQGHPPVNAFMAVPVFQGERLVGVYGLANRKSGYDEEMLETMRPVSTTYGIMIHAARVAARDNQAQLEMLEAKNQAEQASRAKSEFLSRMSHELRTPLNAILGFSQLLEHDSNDPLSTNQRENLDEISKAGTHLLNLINEVLDLARIEAGRMDIQVQRVDLFAMLDDCMALLAPVAEQSGVALQSRHCQCEPGSIQSQVYVRADAMRLKQVLINLLSNAIKYNHANGTVQIECKLTDTASMRLEISDTGRGINAQQLGKLFKPFNRLGAENSAIEGAGIGLVIAKRFIELMHGRIGVESIEGLGSTFWVELPLATDAENSSDAEVSEAYINPEDEPQAAAGDVGEAHWTVMYVEDNPANMRLVQHLFKRRKQFTLLAAETGELGVEFALRDRPDIILMDINLPGIDGYEAMAQIRDVYPDIPVIALSANATNEDIQQGLQAGFNAYLTKPVDAVRLMATVDAELQASGKHNPASMAG